MLTTVEEEGEVFDYPLLLSLKTWFSSKKLRFVFDWAEKTNPRIEGHFHPLPSTPPPPPPFSLFFDAYLHSHQSERPSNDGPPP